MIHQVFDVGIHTFLGGQADPAIMNLSWTLRQVFERLFDDTETLADFLNTHEITIVHITGLANGNLEFKLVVIIIWKPLPNIVWDTGGTDIADRQTSSATRLDQIVDFLAGAEPIPEIGDGAQIDQIRSDADEVIGNPAEFRENDPDVLGPLRYFYSEHLLDRHGIGDAVHHRRHVIQAIGEGNDLPVHVRLSHLFEASMKESNFSIGVDDLFTVDSRLKPECPMHCRMLRSNVEYLRMRQSH